MDGVCVIITPWQIRTSLIYVFSPVLQILSKDTGTHPGLNQLTASFHYTSYVMSSFMYVCLDLNVDIFIC